MSSHDLCVNGSPQLPPQGLRPGLQAQQVRNPLETEQRHLLPPVTVIDWHREPPLAAGDFLGGG